jgi:hypothetical protein
MKSVKEIVMMCALVLTLLLVVDVQRAEGVCCPRLGSFNLFGFYIGGGDKDFSCLVQFFHGLKVPVPPQTRVRTVMKDRHLAVAVELVTYFAAIVTEDVLAVNNVRLAAVKRTTC